MSSNFKELILQLKVEMDADGATAEMHQFAASVLGVGDAGDEATDRTSEGMDKLGKTSRASGHQVGYVFAQLNDIGVMMAAGQNPFQLAIQQGTQLTQVFGPLGVRGSLSALSGAFLQLLSPINLITIGGIAASAAMVSWLTSAGDEAKTLKDKLDDLTAQMKAYQDAVDATSVSQAELEDRFGSQAEKVRAQLEAALEDERRKLEFEIDATVSVTIEESDLDFGKLLLDDRNQAADMFGMSYFYEDTVEQLKVHKKMINAVIEDYEALSVAAEGSTSDQIAAVEQLLISVTAASEAVGGITEEENNRIIGLRELLLKLHELKALEDRQDADSNTKARELDEELTHKAAMIEAERRYGDASAEVHNLKLAQARAQKVEEIELLRISQERKDALIAQWDAANPERDPIAERSKAANEQLQETLAQYREQQAAAAEMLVTLQEENQIRAAIKTYGEDSARVEQLRQAQARRIFEAKLDELNVSEEIKNEIRAAWEAGEKLNNTNMSDGIRAAGEEARRVADELVRALAASQSLSSSAAGALQDAEIRAKHAGDPVETARQLGVQRMIRTQGVRRDGAEGGELAALDAEARQYGDTMAKIAEQDKRTRDQLRSSSGGRGKRARETLQDLQAEAQEILIALQVATGGVNEKVQAGLLSTTEGAREIDRATERAAGSIADLIPRLERIGPAGAGSVEQLRKKLQELVGDLDGVRSKLSQTLSDSFTGSLADVTSGIKSAKDAFSDFASSVIREITRIMAQRFTNRFVTPLIDGLLSIFPFADGGVPGGDLKQYRNQIVGEPTFFGMPGGNVGVFGEAGDEAIMPLQRVGGGHGVLATGPGGDEGVLPLERTGSGALGVSLPAELFAAFAPSQFGPDAAQSPAFFAQGAVFGAFGQARSQPAIPAVQAVAAQGGAPGRPNVEVNVNTTAPDTKASVHERDEGGTRIIDVLIEQVERGIASNVARHEGPLAAVLKGASGGISR